jgi:hypothetical protein
MVKMFLCPLRLERRISLRLYCKALRWDCLYPRLDKLSSLRPLDLVTEKAQKPAFKKKKSIKWRNCYNDPSLSFNMTGYSDSIMD